MARPTKESSRSSSIKDTYLVRWTMPNDSQVVGVGILSGDQLSVSYYGGTPALVVYSIAENGTIERQVDCGRS